MRVTLSVNGRFDAFDQARELSRRGHLQRLITSYPKFEARRFGVASGRVKSNLAPELLRRAWAKLPARLRGTRNPQHFLHGLFERYAARSLPSDTEVFTGWSGSSLAALVAAKELGAVTFVARLSTHMEFQRDIVLEEYARHGIRPRVAHPLVVEKELAEYEVADRIMVPSQFARQTFIDRGFAPERLVTVPFGVDLTRFHPAGERRDSDGVFRVLHCGAVNIRKGCHTLLESFLELDLPQSELWFVGRVAPEFEPLRRACGDARVRFFGSRPQDELPALYRGASVFCLASIEEGLAMVQAQAMACGLPLCSSTHTGAADLLAGADAGRLFPARDAEALKETLMWFFEHPEERGAMGARAAQHVQQHFSWGAYGNRIEAAYGQALAEHRATGARGAVRVA